jgi:hypothetical protein
VTSRPSSLFNTGSTLSSVYTTMRHKYVSYTPHSSMGGWTVVIARHNIFLQTRYIYETILLWRVATLYYCLSQFPSRQTMMNHDYIFSTSDLILCTKSLNDLWRGFAYLWGNLIKWTLYSLELMCFYLNTIANHLFNISLYLTIFLHTKFLSENLKIRDR